MYRFALLIIVLSATLSSCGLYYRAIHKQVEGRMGHSTHCEIYDIADSALINNLAFFVRHIGLHEHDSVLSIGAGSGSREFVFSFFTDNILFYLEDIDTSCITKNKINSIYLPHYSAMRGRPLTNTFVTVGGTERKLSLGNEKVNKIIIYNSYHHFNDDMAMVWECNRVLIRGGKLIISENVMKRNKKSYKFCDYGGKYKTEENFVKDITAAGFRCDSVARSGEYYRDFFFTKE